MSAGSVHIEGVGLAWLILGVICTSIPKIGNVLTWLAAP
jgi:hypothetical protein